MVRRGWEGNQGLDWRGPGLEEQFKEEAWGKNAQVRLHFGSISVALSWRQVKEDAVWRVKPSPLPCENKLSFLVCSLHCLHTSGYS